tara:strand:- start:277 stop:927 length:651 start_codon:yes stop_codon:yes gene_type:complete
MVGFVGSRARKRKRNFITIFLFLVIIFFIFYIIPDFELSDNVKPEDSVLPDPNEKISSLSSQVDDLNLEVFQKNQKIKFRDDQLNVQKNEIIEIKNNYIELKNEHSKLKEEYKKTIDIKNSLKNNSAEGDLNEEIKNLSKKNKEQKILLGKLSKNIDELKNKNEVSFSSNKDLNDKYEKLLKDNKNLKKDIDKLESIIEIQKIEIKNLKDVSHHNQ